MAAAQKDWVKFCQRSIGDIRRSLTLKDFVYFIVGGFISFIYSTL